MNIEISHKGSLKDFGYSPTVSKTARLKALREATKVYGKDEMIRKLNAIAVLTKNSQPQNSEIYREDMERVRRMRL